MRKFLFISGGLLLFLSAIALGVWLSRGMIAKRLIADACTARGLVCTVEGAEISLSKVNLTGLAVQDTAGNAVAGADIGIDLDWPGLFTPAPTKLAVSGAPFLNLRYDGSAIFLGDVALDTLTGGDRSRGGELPEITLTDTAVRVSTPAGVLEGTLSASGVWPRYGQLKANLNPVNLEQEPYRLDLRRAKIDLTLSEAQVGGQIEMVIKTAILPHQSLSDAEITADLIDTDRPRIDWTLSAAHLHDERYANFNNLKGAGSATLFKRPGAASGDLPALISSLTLDLEAGRTRLLDREAQTLTVKLQASRGSTAEDFRFEAESAISDGVGPYGRATRATMTAQGQFAGDLTGFKTRGRVVSTGVSASDRASNTVTSAIPVTAPLDAHGDALRSAMRRALGAFSASADFELAVSPSMPLMLVLDGPFALKAESGASILMTPSEGTPVLLYNEDGIVSSGLLSVRGGGFPRTTAIVKQAQQSGNMASLSLGGVKLENWSAGGMTLAADLSALQLATQADAISMLDVDGIVRFDGRLAGLTLSDTSIFGSFAAAQSNGAWRVQTVQGRCIGLEYDSIALTRDLSLQAAATKLCPVGGRLLSSGPDGVSGSLDLGEISLPMASDVFTGRLNLTDARLDWTAGPEMRLALSAGRLDFPTRIDGRTLTIKGRKPEVRLGLNSPITLNAALTDTALSGELVPANISIRALELDSRLADRGLIGDVTGQDVRITDTRSDPLYQPLLGDLSGRFSGADLTLDGPFRLARTGTLIAEARADVNLVTLTGTASVSTPRLTFTRAGLQPKDISDKVRGLLTSARGVAEARADFRLDRGRLSGTGDVSLDAFGIDTLRLGPINGINGDIRFSDLIAISTPPDQTLTIDQMDPGLPLRDGALKFQILDGRQIRIESVTWPFAGGHLRVAQSLWTIAGTEDTVIVSADRIELRQLVETLKVPDLQADGTVSGVFPIDLTAGGSFVRNAKFKVDEEGGRIAYHGALLNQAGTGNEMVGEAFNALQNLQYSVLELTLDGNLLGDITLGALILGRNPDVLGGSEFEFDISIDSRLAQLLQTGREAASTNWLTEAVARQVEEDDPPQE